MIVRIIKSVIEIIPKVVLSIITFILAGYGFGFCGEVCFLEGQPRYDRPGLYPYKTAMYCYNDTDDSLELKWELGDNVWAYDIRVYPSEGLILIVTGRYSAEDIYIISTETIGLNDYISMKEYGYFDQSKLLVYKDSNYVVGISYYLEGKNNSGTPSWKFFDLSDNQRSVEPEFVMDNCRLILSGPLPPFGSGTDDIQLLRSISEKGFKAYYDITDLKLPGLFEETKLFESPRGLVLFANEKDFAALMSIPFKHGSDKNDIQILNKQDNIWNHYRIAGLKTELRLINDWLVGEKANIDPRTNFDNAISYPPVRGNGVVFINPLENRNFEIQLGDSCEVLWIDNDNNIYYHIADSLFVGRIEGENIFDRKLILQDPRIRRIHWAFEK